jgi:P27 family predicted phage terminase small subunit
MPRGSGRRPLATAIKRLRGNPGRRPLNDAEPMPASGEPQMPTGLSETAKAEWQARVPELLKLGVLSTNEGAALAAYCYEYARWWEADKEIVKRGLLIEEPVVNNKGQVVGHRIKKNPAIAIANEALKIMKSYMVELGLTPAARSRIRVEKPPEDDPFEHYLNRRRRDGVGIT